MKIRKSNYILTIVTTSLVLFFLGLYVLFVLHSKQLGKHIKEQANIVIELKDDLPLEQRNSLQTSLESDPRLVEGSLQYVSKEEGLAIMKEDLELANIQVGDDNPLKDIYEFNVYEEFLNNDALVNLKEEFLLNPNIIAVVYQEEFYNSISEKISAFSRIFFVFSFLFLIISIVLIHNTFFLRLQGDRSKIKTMEFVGADWAFIKKPYILESYKVAFYAWLVSSILILMILWIIWLSYPEIGAFLSVLNFIWSFLIMAVISFAICTVSARSIINRYFRATPDKL